MTTAIRYLDSISFEEIKATVALQFHTTEFFKSIMIPYYYWLQGVITYCAQAEICFDENFEMIVKTLKRTFKTRIAIFKNTIFVFPRNDRHIISMIKNAFQMEYDWDIGKFNFEEFSSYHKILQKKIIRKHKIESVRFIKHDDTYDWKSLIEFGECATFYENENTQNSFRNYFRYYYTPINFWQLSPTKKYYWAENTKVKKHTVGWISFTSHVENYPLLASDNALRNKILNNCIYIPFFHCNLTESRIDKKSIFLQLATVIKKRLDDINFPPNYLPNDHNNIPVIFATHCYMTSQIVLLWSAGMNLLDYHIDKTEVMEMELMNYEEFRTLNIEVQNEFFQITQRLQTEKRDFVSRTDIDSFSKIYCKALPEAVTGKKIDIFNPIGHTFEKVFVDLNFTKDFQHNISNIQNTVYFISTIGKMLAMKSLSRELFNLIQ